MQNWASSAQNLERVGNSLWSGANLQLIKRVSCPGKHSTQVTRDGQQEVKKCSWKVGGEVGSLPGREACWKVPQLGAGAQGHNAAYEAGVRAGERRN